jgi:capsid portal protein
MRPDRLRKYKVLLDGKTIGAIANGETKSFEVKPGDHSLFLKIDWARSNKLDFSLSTPQQVIHFKCSSALKGDRVWLAAIYALFLFNKMLELERID